MASANPVSPEIVERAEQRYVGIRRSVTLTTIGSIADRLPERFGWLGQRGAPPAGAPFLRYDVIDMERASLVWRPAFPSHRSDRRG